MNVPKIGVLMPTHKRPEIIWRAIDSLKKQTEKDFFLIVIGNGMTDAELLSYEFDRIKDVGRSFLIINYPHFANLAMALQMGLAFLPVGTKYVSVLEDDDEWHPDFLKKMSAELDRRQELVMAYCDEIELDPSGVEVDWTVHHDSYDREALLAGNWIHFPVQMWRYNALIGTGGFSPETSGSADWDIALRMSALGVYHLRERLATHHWLTDRFDNDPLNNCLDPKKMESANRWIEIRKRVGVYS